MKTIAPGLGLAYAGRACGRETSEDFFDASCPDADERAAHGVAFAIADGSSGSAGRRTAETIVRTVLTDYYATPAPWDVELRLERVIGAVNSWLLAANLRGEGARSMLSTLSVLVVHGNQAHVAHVGNCRIYRIRDGEFECMTTDHVWPHKEMRHVLRRAVGLDQHLVIDCFADDLRAGDAFMLLSDGVWEVLGEKAVREAIATPLDPGRATHALVEQSVAKQRHYYGRNDATAALLRIAAMPA